MFQFHLYFQKKVTNIDFQDTLKFLVPKTETFEYLLKELPERVNLIHNKGIRLFEVTGSKITRIIQPSTSVRTVYSGNIVAEEILTEETNKDPEDKILNVLHGWSGMSSNQPLKFFGDPFRCLSKKVCNVPYKFSATKSTNKINRMNLYLL